MSGAHCEATRHHVAVGCLVLDNVADVREGGVLHGGALYVALAPRDLAWKQAVIDELVGQHLSQGIQVAPSMCHQEAVDQGPVLLFGLRRQGGFPSADLCNGGIRSPKLYTI